MRMMKSNKQLIFAIKAAVSILLVIILQSSISHYFIESIIPPEITSLRKIREQKTDILFMADSTNRTTIGNDSKQAISEILQELVPELKVRDISHAAYNLNIYLEYVRNIVKQKNRPSIIIIPISIRSFSSSWDMKPDFQFEKEKLFLKYDSKLFDLFFKPLAVLKTFNLNTVTWDSYNKAPVYDGTKLICTVDKIDNPEIGTWTWHELQTTWNYLGAINPEHRRLLALREISRLSRGAGIDVLYYITPVNYQFGVIYTGNRFTKQVKRNADLVNNVAASCNNSLLDLSQDLGITYFQNDGQRINEHLNFNGRRYVAERLAESIRNSGQLGSPVVRR